jgi:hypothetical protein
MLGVLVEDSNNDEAYNAGLLTFRCFDQLRSRDVNFWIKGVVLPALLCTHRCRLNYYIESSVSSTILSLKARPIFYRFHIRDSRFAWTFLQDVLFAPVDSDVEFRVAIQIHTILSCKYSRRPAITTRECYPAMGKAMAVWALTRVCDWSLN